MSSVQSVSVSCVVYKKECKWQWGRINDQEEKRRRKRYWVEVVCIAARECVWAMFFFVGVRVWVWVKWEGTQGKKKKKREPN